MKHSRFIALVLTLLMLTTMVTIARLPRAKSS